MLTHMQSEPWPVTDPVDEDLQVLVFQLDDQEYALGIDFVVRVARMVALTPALAQPPHVAGLMNVHGTIVPVIDVRPLRGLPLKPYSPDTQLLVAQAGDRPLGLIVDVVCEVLTLPADCLTRPETLGLGTAYLSAVGRVDDRLVLVLDPLALITAIR